MPRRSSFQPPSRAAPSRNKMASEYVSSPEAHPAERMRSRWTSSRAGWRAPPDTPRDPPPRTQRDEPLGRDDPDRLDDLCAGVPQQGRQVLQQPAVEGAHADDRIDGQGRSPVAEPEGDPSARGAAAAREQPEIDDGRGRPPDDRQPGHEGRRARDRLDREGAHHLDDVCNRHRAETLGGTHEQGRVAAERVQRPTLDRAGLRAGPEARLAPPQPVHPSTTWRLRVPPPPEGAKVDRTTLASRVLR